MNSKDQSTKDYWQEFNEKLDRMEAQINHNRHALEDAIIKVMTVTLQHESK